MSREEKLREMADQEQALMREIYGFDNGVVWERERIIKLLEEQRIELAAQGGMTEAITIGMAIALIKGENK